MGPYQWCVKIGSGNGLLPSGNKPLAEPVSTQIFVTIWHHKATIITHLIIFTLPLHSFIWYIGWIWMAPNCIVLICFFEISISLTLVFRVREFRFFFCMHLSTCVVPIVSESPCNVAAKLAQGVAKKHINMKLSVNSVKLFTSSMVCNYM